MRAHCERPHASTPPLGRRLAVAFLACCIALPAAAQEDDDEADYAREGGYLSASGVFVDEQWAGALSDIGAEDTWAIDFRAGLRVSPWAAVELALEVSGDFFPDDRQDFSFVHAGLNTRVYPLGGLLGRVQPFAIGGLGIVSTVVEHRDRNTALRQSNADWGFRGGGGVDLYYTDHVALSLQGSYVWTVGDVKNVDYVSLSLGILYRF